MYIPKLFNINYSNEVRHFIKDVGFGTVVSQGEKRIHGSHLPLLLHFNKQGQEVLSGHFSKANTQWHDATSKDEVLVIFQGPHAYISSSWYDHSNVPTYNYIAVHIYGSMRIQSTEELLFSLREMTNKYEANSSNPSYFDSMDKNMIEDQLKGIVGFEISINEVQAAYKLSQNRDDKNHSLIVEELKKTGDTNSSKLADEMTKNRLNNS
jgi:transcriptional regulator